MAEKSQLHYLKNIKLRTKMIFLVSAIVFLCVVPLSTIVYFKNKVILLEKTYEVCQSIANNIAKIADDELLIGDTFEATNSALTKLKDSRVRALVDTYIIDLDGKIVARLNPGKKEEKISKENFTYFLSLEELTSRERKSGSLTILQFTYPIFIKYKTKNMRIGTAVFEFNSEDIFSPINELRNSIFFIACILFFLGIGIAIFIGITLSAPLQVLSEGAIRFGAGDFNHRILLDGKDEIGKLAQAFNVMGEKIQDFTNHLEQKVSERTHALNNTLAEVNALKEAQDGDYYLTSLLLEPLSTNNNYSKKIKTEFITEQKKKFSFRKWNSQIGGDICITDTIRLRDKDYTVFLNADAMGKSIQGAGGALVLGVVFNAGLIRSRMSSQKKVYPENWLKERFLDLQNVFLSFDGTMYISVCIGLIENENGMMYYINAEHPATVLYRDEKASFLEEGMALSKIGTPGQEQRFYVRTFRLLPGDILITGSDGRDDVIVGYDGETEIINEDETQFLRHIENGKGNLNSIAAKIKEFGKLYDDFSLIRISFDEDHSDHSLEINPIQPEIRSKLNQSSSLIAEGKSEEALSFLTKIIAKEKPFPELLALLGKGYMDTKQWEKAIECYSQYLNFQPLDNEALFLISQAFNALGKKSEAADYGERLLLRDPKHLANLIHLAQAHQDLEIFSRATYVIKKALEIDQKNEKAKSILESLMSREGNFAEFESESGEISRKSPEEQKIESIAIAERLFKMNRFKDCIVYYSKALSFDQKDVSVLCNLGNVYFKMGEIQKAKEEWEGCLRLEPKFSAAKESLNRLAVVKKIGKGFLRNDT